MQHFPLGVVSVSPPDRQGTDKTGSPSEFDEVSNRVGHSDDRSWVRTKNYFKEKAQYLTDTLYLYL